MWNWELQDRGRKIRPRSTTASHMPLRRTTLINLLGPETAGWGSLKRRGGRKVRALPFAGISRTLGVFKKVCAENLRAHFSCPSKGEKSAIRGITPLDLLNFLQWSFGFLSRFSVQFSQETAPRCGEIARFPRGENSQNSVTSLASWFIGPEKSVC